MNSYSTHHYPPRSRNGNHRAIRIPDEFHQAWHVLFKNLYRWETILYLIDLQEICHQCNQGKVAKDKVVQAQKGIRGLDERPPFFGQSSYAVRVCTKHFKGKCDNLPGSFQDAWNTIFGGEIQNREFVLQGYEVTLFAEKMQELFTDEEFVKKGQIDKSDIEELRQEIVGREAPRNSLLFRFGLNCYG